MSELKRIRLLSEYNRLMNERLYAAAERLSDQELRADKGAFFGSVLGTLNHLMVGDIIWLKRFSAHPSSGEALACLRGIPRPASLDAIVHADFRQLKSERVRMDAVIQQWTAGLSLADLEEPLAYENMKGLRFRKPFGDLIQHLFLHQVHHRGQATTLLSQAGIDFGDTDLIEIIAEV